MVIISQKKNRVISPETNIEEIRKTEIWKDQDNIEKASNIMITIMLKMMNKMILIIVIETISKCM